MVNGNYVLYGDRPSSESEIVDDHVQTKTAERKTRRKTHRTANELQSTLNLAQLDNETDSVKYEKRIKEPRLLRYVPTSDVEEHFVTEKFETYDLKPTEERPRRYAFTKKPKNPADGSVNYAYSRSSSSCSSPNGNLPTISEHAEQYGTYRVRPAPSPPVVDMISGYESKLDKYFAKPRDVKQFAAKGSHPDSLYRVPSGNGAGAAKVARVLRVLRWPAALIVVCVALAVFVYFLMPDNIDNDLNPENGTYWDTVAASLGTQTHKHPDRIEKNRSNTPVQPQGTKTPEIDFYDADTAKTFETSPYVISATESNSKRKLPIPPVFPVHITPEVQYGNEKADSDKLRNPKQLDETNTVSADSTLKPHITQKPEKPLAIFVKDSNGITTTTSTETIVKAETLNDLTNYGEKFNTKKTEISITKPQPSVYREQIVSGSQINNGSPITQVNKDESQIPAEIQEFYQRNRPTVVDVRFTSGHSKLFGISIEDAEKMHSTTQSSTYNTRVSPTLPTWRDRDDSTTKKYPVNVNYDVPQCHSTRLAFCHGVLPYDLAGPAATLNGVELTQLLSHVEFLVSTNCSERVRQFMCALLEPECNPPPLPPKMPCYNLCKAITDSCEGLIPHDLAAAFNCNQYPSSNCVAAKSPCSQREFPCNDGSCVPRDWICDGAQDCAAGEDEQKCVICDANEYRCQSGGCIQKRWMCDGYSDCPSGEDETVDVCETYGVVRADQGGHHEPGEESAGSAPAPAVHRLHRTHPGRTAQKLGDNDSSKELLVTSDSSNVPRRNFTRRPSLSRLSPYTRPTLQDTRSQNKDASNNEKPNFSKQVSKKKANDKKPKSNSMEDVNIGDFGFFEDLDKDGSDKKHPDEQSKMRSFGGVPPGPEPNLTHLDKSINNLEKVIDGASLLRKAVSQQEMQDSPEVNSTTVEMQAPPRADSTFSGLVSAHASPCPSGELRCVDGRCITLAQLCDGTIDCSDHADEDNCYA